MFKPLCSCVLLILTLLTAQNEGQVSPTRVVNNLLKSAVFSYSLGYGEKVFMKRGGFQKALEDFKDVVDPNTIRALRIGSGLRGKVGELRIKLLNANDYVSMPSMSIYSESDIFPKAIIKYKD